MNALGKTTLEVPKLLEISGGSQVNVEDSNISEKELEREVGLSCQLKKAHSYLGAEGIKERGNHENSKEESDTDEEEDYEGEIEMVTPGQKKARGRKSTKEVREQAMYKDKIQCSELTLEKLL